jgi:ribosome maturation factor RimP
MKQEILQILQPLLDERGLVLVDFQSPAEHRFQIFIDGQDNVSIDTCIQIARQLRALGGEALDPFDLTVSSPGLDKPFRHPIQFQKNIGKHVEILMEDGRKLIGKLDAVQEESLHLICMKPSVHKGGKPKYDAQPTILERSAIKQTVKHIVF